MVTSFYPYDELGPMYVHTNYNSFLHGMSIGSFADRETEISGEMQHIIAFQENREKKITKHLQDVFGEEVTIEEILHRYNEWFGQYADVNLKNAYLYEDVKLKKTKGGVTAIAHSDQDVKKSFNELKQATSNITKAMNKLIKKGYVDEDSSVILKKELDKHLNEFKSKIQDWEDGGKEGSIGKILYGSVMNFKGKLKEYLELALHASAIDAITEGMISASEKTGFKVIAVGGTRKPGADVQAVIDSDGRVLSYGLNIKSTSKETFKKHGIHLYSPQTLHNLVDHLSSFMTQDSVLAAFKYYLVNISRMMGKPMTDQQGKGGIANTEQGRKLVQSVLKAYAPVFIGEDSPRVPEEFRQADFLITKDMILKKSDILRGLSKGEKTDFSFSIALEISYNKGYNWSRFDTAKRLVMRAHEGDYDAMLSSTGFVQRAFDAMMQQSATVRLKLLLR